MSQTIDYYYDFSSPYAYLACEEIAKIADRCGAKVNHIPFLLGGLFRLVELDMSNGPPIMQASENKQRHLSEDMARYADLRGLPFAWPPTFPLNTVRPLRVMLQLSGEQHRSLALRIFKAYWGEGAEIADPTVLGGIITEEGLDAEALLTGCQDPVVKAKLIANTTALFEAGGCGAPSFVVGGHLFWGQDRMDMVEAVLNGWTPPKNTVMFGEKYQNI